MGQTKNRKKQLTKFLKNTQENSTQEINSNIETDSDKGKKAKEVRHTA